MASENITAFRDEVSFYIKGASKSTNTTFIDKQIVRIIRDFCKKTWIWRYTLTEIDVVEDQANYTLTLPTTDGSADLVMVDWAKFKADGTDDNQYTYLEPINLLSEELPSSTSRFSAGYVNETTDAPTFFYVDPDDTLYLLPTPNSTAAGTANLQVKVIVMPALTATKVPDFIYDDWVEVLAKGVAGRVCNMASERWYDPKLSDRYTYQYKKARDDEARAQRWQGKNRKQMTVRVPKGFSGGSRSGNDWIF
jgi:hypothetical protein